MKSLFLSLWLVSSAHAGMIRIQFETDLELAVQIKRKLSQRHAIPLSLIEVLPVKSCALEDRRYLNLCLNKKRELTELPSSKNIAVKKSLSIFKRLKK